MKPVKLAMFVVPVRDPRKPMTSIETAVGDEKTILVQADGDFVELVPLRLGEANPDLGIVTVPWSNVRCVLRHPEKPAAKPERKAS